MNRMICAGGLAANSFAIAINLAWLRYGVPEHFDGSWWKVAFFSVFALMCGYVLVSRKEP